jgi:arsenate reductase
MPFGEMLLLAGLALFVWWLWRDDVGPWMASRPPKPQRPSRSSGKKERVLFVCTHNSARSQMAEAWLRELAKDRFHVASAGTAPTHLHPLADWVMGERGVSMRWHQAKGLSAVGTHWDYVITVCDAAFEECPDFPLKTSRLHWSVSDPAAVTGGSAERIEAFQRARDELASRIARWLSDRPERLPAAP